MGFEKDVDIIERIDKKICMRNTGRPDELADQLGISPSWLYEILNVMKTMGADIVYDNIAKTYYYAQEGCFNFRFVEKK